MGLFHEYSKTSNDTLAVKRAYIVVIIAHILHSFDKLLSSNVH